MQKINVKGPSVQKLEWKKRTDRRLDGQAGTDSEFAAKFLCAENTEKKFS